MNYGWRFMDIVQETGIKTIPMEKKCKKAKWLSGEDLQIAVKRRCFCLSRNSLISLSFLKDKFAGYSLAAQTVKRLPTMQETRLQALGQEDLLEKGKATHSSILAWRIPWIV